MRVVRILAGTASALVMGVGMAPAALAGGTPVPAGGQADAGGDVRRRQAHAGGDHRRRQADARLIRRGAPGRTGCPQGPTRRWFRS
jgi:hypothetical protein